MPVQKFNNLIRVHVINFFIMITFFSCSKGGGSGPAPNPCTGVTIVVSGTVSNPTTARGTNGSIAAVASGSSGFTFSINGAAFQSSGSFSGLAAGSYTITAKNNNGCTGSAVFTLSDPPGASCSGVTINVTGATTGNTPCEAANGKITVTATGGSGTFTYSLNGGAFQASNIFTNLAAANYVVTAKDANGCTGNVNVTVTNLSAGPLFSAVKAMMQTNCVSCHNNTVSNGGMNWTVDCNIVTFKDRIKARAVDGIPSPMPQGGSLPPSEKQKITDWINAGGKYTN